ncbi:MAG: M56 family metallopeptidase, partial [Sphingomicrobium sp.]
MSYGVFDLAVRATLLLLATWGAATIIERRGSSAAKRHAVWAGGFVALALLPLCSLLLPRLALPVLPAEAVTLAPAAVGPTLVPTVRATAPGFDATAALATLYLGIVALLVARIVVGRLLLARLWKRGAPLSDPAKLELTQSLCESLGIGRVVAVRISDSAIVPMTWGSFSPSVLLPSEAAHWPAKKWRSVLLHELGHVSRHDSLARLGVETLCAFYWLHPLVWLSARRLRLAQEQACDDLALTGGASAIGYARDLLDSAGAFHR